MAELDANKLLTQLEAQCRIAREALRDEHEGDFRRAVGYIATDADKLAELVTER